MSKNCTILMQFRAARPSEYSMTRTELMYAASKKLDEAAMLLLAAAKIGWRWTPKS